MSVCDCDCDCDCVGAVRIPVHFNSIPAIPVTYTPITVFCKSQSVDW